jgi:hypothetical protein
MALKVKAVERLLKFDKESAGLVFRKKKEEIACSFRNNCIALRQFINNN